MWWGFSRREVVGFLVVVALLAMGWLFLVRPEQERAARLSKELLAIEEQSKDADRIVAELGAVKRELERMRAEMAFLEQRVLKEEDISRILTRISEEAKRFGVRIVSLRPLEEKGTIGVYQRLPVELELKGRYLELGRLLEALEQGPLLFTFENLNLRHDRKEPSSVTLKGVAVAYMRREEG